MVNIKLTSNAEQFPSDQHCLAYVYGRLEGNALAQVQPYITASGITLVNVPALLDILQTAFGDPDLQGTTTRELRKLRQANKEFSIYVADFMRLLAIVPWDEHAKLNHLRAGLSLELQHGLVFLEDATTVQVLITQVTRLEARQRALQANSQTTQPWRETGEQLFHNKHAPSLLPKSRTALPLLPTDPLLELPPHTHPLQQEEQ